MSSWEDKWLVKTTKKVVPEVNVWPNVSLFNRKLYTFGEKEEAYIKLDWYDAYIESYDELCFYDTNSCIYRVSQDDYIITLNNGGSPDDFKVAVLGQLGQRYLRTNRIAEYDVEIRNPDDYKIVHLSEIGDKNKVSFEDLQECVALRVAKNYEHYREQIRKGTADVPPSNKEGPSELKK